VSHHQSLSVTGLLLFYVCFLLIMCCTSICLITSLSIDRSDILHWWSLLIFHAVQYRKCSLTVYVPNIDDKYMKCDTHSTQLFETQFTGCTEIIVKCVNMHRFENGGKSEAIIFSTSIHLVPPDSFYIWLCDGRGASGSHKRLIS